MTYAPNQRRRFRRLSIEGGSALFIMAGALGMAFVTALGLQIANDWMRFAVWAGGGAGVLMLVLASYLRTSRPYQAVANILAAMRKGDYITRSAAAGSPGALGLLSAEVNALSVELAGQRMRAVEATALLASVIDEIEVAVIAFDEREAVRMANRAAERLLGQSRERLNNRTAEDLGLRRFLHGDLTGVADAAFRGGIGRYTVRRGAFREHGRPHQFLVIADVGQIVRHEERAAWQRLVRVLSHELNNSLAPIQSIAHSLSRLLDRPGQSQAHTTELREGLLVIHSRSASLARFIASYTHLERLPSPKREAVELRTLLARIGAAETRCRVTIANGPNVELLVDVAQIEQLLINLTRNAAEASLTVDASEPIDISWELTDGRLAIIITDSGAGLPTSANLFVPYFTTKPNGTGLGLVVAREIAEAHGGALQLANRGDRPGCRATLLLPLSAR